jgi:hypothetical protein
MTHAPSRRSSLYILEGRTPVPVDEGSTAWSAWFVANNGKRHVAFTEFARGDERCSLSTVFLGVDHNFRGVGAPVLFETMIFGANGGSVGADGVDASDEYQERYTSWEAAEAGHAEARAMLEALGWRDTGATFEQWRDALGARRGGERDGLPNASRASRVARHIEATRAWRAAYGSR